MEQENLKEQEDGFSPSLGSDGKPTVVGIGASAGGLAALKRLFELIPSDSGLVFVVVVHLSPEHKSFLPDLLQPSVRFPVRQVTETIPLEPNNVYVIPPNANLSTIDTHLRLSKLEEQRRERAPIDHFFRTLASTHDGHSIGVVLTGTGSDGTLGLKEIKAKGGLILVQDPNEAEFDGMPQSAIATGLVDRVLPLAQIAEALVRLTQVGPRIALNGDSEHSVQRERVLLPRVVAVLKARTERDFSRYKPATILRRIARRMQLNYIEDFELYLEKLREHPEEARALADDLLITVTSFFRDPDVFQKLEKEVVPQLFQAKGPEDTLRVWSVGCATGEEAYSVAMLLLEEAARRDAAPKIQIFASDLHKRSLAGAREGLYPGDIQTDVSPERLERFFKKENGCYRICKELRDTVLFAPHNLLSDPPFSRLNLITCRNLLIYLDRPVQRDAIDLFHYALCPNGYLLLGSAETIDSPELFRTEDKKLCLYRKRNVPGPEPRLPVFPLTTARAPGKRSVQGETAAEPIPYHLLHQKSLERYAPPSVLVAADNTLVHLSQNAGRYLVHPGGEVTLSILKLVREELRIELRALLQSARETKGLVDSRPISVRFNGHTAPVVMRVRPAQDADQDDFLLVIFDEHQPPRDSAISFDAERGAAVEPVQDPKQIVELEAELNAARQRLQTTIEEYETSQEEMKASNEEMQSTNEELRSTMEELETSKEELQSINEELQTVNQENRHKVEELSQLSSDLQNLLSATEIATLFLDRDLRIMRFTPRVAELFNIRVTDRGRPISDLTHRLGYPELREDAQAVLDHLIPSEREIRDDRARWYLTRVLPYRSTEHRIEGVVITFTEITTQKSAEAVLRESEERQALMLKLSDTLQAITDPAEIEQAGMRVLGEQLGLSRAFYFRVERADDGWVQVIESEYSRDAGQSSMIGRHSLKQFGSWLFEGLEQGRVLEVPDVAAVAGLTPKELASYRTRGVAAFINVPLLRNGEYSAGITAHDTVPRAWRPAEIALIREVAIRTSEAMERARAEEALRVNEKRLRGQKEAFQAAIDGAPLQESLRILVRMVSEETAGAARTAFYIADGDLTCLHPVPGAGDMPQSYSKLVDRFPIAQDSLACGLACTTGRPVLTRDVFEEPLWKPWVHLAKEYDFRACWSFPIETRDHKPIGTFAMYFRDPHDPKPHELGLAEVITQTASIIISRHEEAQERARAEKTLSESERLFRLLVENVREYALVQTDKDGLVTSWNPGAHRLFGYSAEEMLGHDFSVLLTPEDLEAGLFRRELAKVAAGQRNEDARWFVRQDGSRFWARWISEPICDETDQFRGVAKIMRDETERERSEAFTRHSLAEKEELLKEVHHRVKNNLQVIISLLNMQTLQIQDERVLALFQETRNRVLAISSIHELLYRAESFANIALSDYARQLAPGLVRFYGLEPRVQLEIQGDGTTLELERAVPYGMLLNELISNACKHAFPPPQTGTLTVSIQPDGDHIVLIVADTGQGLPAGFDYQKAASLGLKLVHGLVRQLRGTIDITSKPGTTVKVRFPAAGMEPEQ